MAGGAADPGARRLRLKLVAAGAQLASSGLIVGTEGNLSVRIDETRCLITPAWFDKGRLEPSDLLVVTLTDVDPPRAASSEARLHVAVYRSQAEVAAVVHTHAPQVQALAARGRMPDPGLLLEGRELLAEVGRVGGLRPGSRELAEAVVAALHGAPACVLERHGAVTVGRGLLEAVRRMLLLERLATLTAAKLER